MSKPRCNECRRKRGKVKKGSRSNLVDDRRNRRSPLLKLERPVCDGRERDDDEVGSVLLLGLDEEGDEGEGLNRLSETL